MTTAEINPTLSLITLHVNETNSKRQRSYWQNIIQIESRMVAARDCGGEKGSEELVFHGYRVSFGVNEKILEMKMLMVAQRRECT